MLWRKVNRGLSAGRVQSVATRLVVERERERMAHVAANYWDIEAEFEADSKFTARVSQVDGLRVAQGRDFGDDGQLKKPLEVLHLNEGAAKALADVLSGLGAGGAKVLSVEQKPYKRRPAAPFTTSTLQQEAGRKLRWNSRDTMRTAQSLYENGYITYMRTDSTALSKEAISAARAQAREMFGTDSVPSSARVYAKKAKGAQEAHEAIRPAGNHFRTPAELATKLSSAQLALYDLIWKRTLASQMTDATGTTDTLRIGMRTPSMNEVGPLASGEHDVIASVSGTVITHRGFLAAYEEGRDAERYADKQSGDQRLPKLGEGAQVDVVSATAEGHETTPPPRYTEASLVRAMEERGIGRPSTYAATISVITDRGYVTKRGQALVPSWLAFSVTRLLEKHFGNLVDYDFTASMEQDLDHIAAGDQNAVAWLKSFYLGEGDDAPKVSADGKGLRHQVESLGDIDARAVNSLDLGGGVTVRVGRYGPYLEREDEARANIPSDVAPDELTPNKVAELFKEAENDGRVLGMNPANGRDIVAMNGRFGPYVSEVISEEEQAGSKKKIKPATASLFKSMDLATVSLEEALQLLSLPREIGKDEEGTPITAQNGRYGPYIKRGTDSRSLESEEQIFSLSLEDALALLAQPKTRGRRAAKPPLREFGLDPVSQKKVTVKDGRWGPYITDGTTNISVPSSESVEGLSEERAFELLAEKRAKGPAKRPARKTTTKKKATRKTTAKKPAAKKTAAKKAAE